MTASFHIIFMQFCIGIIWGVTNVLIKFASSKSASPAGTGDVPEGNWMIVPFICNQLAGLGFVWTLGRSDISVAVPLANAMAFTASGVFAHFQYDEKMGPQSVLGLCFIGIGLCLCCS